MKKSKKQRNMDSKECKKPQMKEENGGQNTDENINIVDADEDIEVIDVASTGDGEELEALKNMVEQREQELEKEKKEYMFLLAEFDNFKKRSLREKSDIIKNAAENVLKGLLPIVDDFERGLNATKDTNDAASIRQGMELIYNKFVKYLNANGVSEIETADQSFDADLHEAIAMVPVTDEDKKGKVIDTVEKGYKLNDKVIRHAKVAVGQ